MQHRGTMESRLASNDMRNTGAVTPRMRSHTGITITPAHSGLPGLDEDITTADLHAMAALNNSFTSQNKKNGAPQQHRNLSFTLVRPTTPRGLDTTPVLQTLHVGTAGDDPSTPLVVTGSSGVNPFAQFHQQEQQQQQQEQQQLLPQQQHQHLPQATNGFNAVKAFAVLAVMLVCSVGLWTSHQAGVLGPMVRRQLVSRGAALGSAAGAGLACPIGSYYGGTNGCKACGGGLTTQVPGAVKLEDCVAPPGSFKPRPRVAKLCDKGTFSADFNSLSSCTPCPSGMTTAAKGATSLAACTPIAGIPTGAQSIDIGSSPSPSPATSNSLPQLDVLPVATPPPQPSPVTPQLEVMPGADALPVPSPVTPQLEVMPGAGAVPVPSPSTPQLEVMPGADALPVPSPSTPQLEVLPGAGAVPVPSPSTPQLEVMPSADALPVPSPITPQLDVMPGASAVPVPSPSTPQLEVLPGADALPVPSPVTPQLEVMPGVNALPVPSPNQPAAPSSSPQTGAVVPNVGLAPISSNVGVSPAPSAAVDVGGGAAARSASPAPKKINLDKIKVVAQPIDLKPLLKGRKLLLQGL